MPTLVPGLLELLLSSVSATDAGPDFGEEGPEDDAVCDGPACAEDRAGTVGFAPTSIVDVRDKAAAAVYRSGSLAGKSKRRLYPPVVLAKRRVVIGLHQMGVEIPTSWPSWWKVTCHYAVRPDGSIAIVHPIDRRLVCTNRVDRAPWHCIGIEFAGNFEGVDGTGNWALPARNGRGRAGEAQLSAGRWLVRHIVGEVAGLGGVVEGILPHRVTGRDSRGRPNRQICPGSRIWSEVGEWSAAELGLAVPGPDFALGGLTIPESWHGRHRHAITRWLTA